MARIRAIANLLFLGLAASAFIGFVTLNYSAPTIDYQLNADSMYVLMITKDILFDGGRLADWYRSVHLFIYPDMLCAIPMIVLHKLGMPVFVSCILIYGLMLTLLLFHAWRKVTRDSISTSFLVATVILGLVFLANYLLYRSTLHGVSSAHLSKALKHTYAVGHVLGPALHSGVFILAFALFFLLYRVLTDSAPSLLGLLTMACVNVILVTLSDLTFVGWGLIPFTLVIFSRSARNPGKTTVLLLALLWGSGIFGSAASWLFSDEANYLAAARRPISQGLTGIYRYFALAGSTTQPAITLFLFANVILWFAGAFSFIKEYRSADSTVSRSLTIFAACMSVASILIPSLAGMFTGDQVRYLIPYLILGPSFCIFYAFCLAREALSFRLWSACLGAGALVSALAGVVAWNTLPGPTATRLYECLKSKGLSSGQADFWDAAPIVVASGWRVNVMPLVPGSLEIFQWQTKRQWLQYSTRSGRIFLIIHPSIETIALASYGLPEVGWSCAGRRILVYQARDRVHVFGEDD